MLTFEAGRKERALLPASLREAPGLLGVLAPGSHSREQKAAQQGGGPLLRSRRALLRSRRGSAAGAASRRAWAACAAGRKTAGGRTDAAAERRRGRPAAGRPDPDLGRVGDFWIFTLLVGLRELDTVNIDFVKLTPSL